MPGLLLALTILAVVQAAVISMITRVDAVEPNVLGLSVALYGSGCLLAGRVRSDDLAARLGGDELAVLLPDATLGRAVELAERLRREAGELELPGFGSGELTLSLGVAAASGEEAYPLELMAQADGQLYRAKITRNAVATPSTPAGLAVPHPAR